MTAPQTAPQTTSLRKTHPLLWSIRREFWEHQSLLFVPLAVVGLALALWGYGLRHTWSTAVSSMEPSVMTMQVNGQDMSAIITGAIGSGVASGILTGVAMTVIWPLGLVAFAYCFSSLHSERRDRTILFWKSLPVSDSTTVLAKAMIPLLIIPAMSLLGILLVQTLLLTFFSIVFALKGLPVMPVWNGHNLFQVECTTLYQLIVFATWYAPVFAWILLVSGWAKRSVFLWTTLPWLGLSLVERMALGSNMVGSLLHDRLMGSYAHAFRMDDGTVNVANLQHFELPQILAPGQYASDPNVWIGLLVAAALIIATIALRRYREPI